MPAVTCTEVEEEDSKHGQMAKSSKETRQDRHLSEEGRAEVAVLIFQGQVLKGQ